MKIKLEVDLNIAKVWVDDGMTAKIAAEMIDEFIKNDLLPYAYEHEVKSKIKIISVTRK